MNNRMFWDYVPGTQWNTAAEQDEVACPSSGSGPDEAGKGCSKLLSCQR